MANLLTPSDFSSGETKIPNAVSLNAGEGQNKDLADLITKYEKKMILILLGETQYTALQDHIEDPGNAPEPWKSLMLGDGFFFEGLKAMAKRYVYCQWLVFDDVTVTSAGKGKKKAQALEMASPVQKYVDRWNELVDDSVRLRDFISSQEELEIWEEFPDWSYKNSLGL